MIITNIIIITTRFLFWIKYETKITISHSATLLTQVTKTNNELTLIKMNCGRGNSMVD
jgi:hypothetical protein